MASPVVLSISRFSACRSPSPMTKPIMLITADVRVKAKRAAYHWLESKKERLKIMHRDLPITLKKSRDQTLMTTLYHSSRESKKQNNLDITSKFKEAHQVNTTDGKRWNLICWSAVSKALYRMHQSLHRVFLFFLFALYSNDRTFAQMLMSPSM